MPTTGYQAAPETNAVVVSYGLEAVWKTPPATTFQALRMTAEGFAGQKTRVRPPEIRTDGQVSNAVTTQESAPGTLNFSLSYGTYDDILAALLGGAWTNALAINGVAADISAVAAGNQITSTTMGKFTAVVVGQVIKTSGFSTLGNNGFGRVATKPDNQTLGLTGITLANETPTGTNAKIRGSMLRNGAAFQSLFVQKQLAAAEFLTYPGAMLTGGTLTATQGQSSAGTATFLAAQEVKATVDSSTGGVLPAPTGAIIDTVAGFKQLQLGGSPIAAVCKGMALTMTRQGAAADYAVGSAAAQGMIFGLMEVSGTADFFFKDFTLYDLFRSEALNVINYLQQDAGGSAYMITLPACALMNPKIVAGGPNQSVMASFTIEGNIDPVTGVSLQIDRFA